MHAAATAAAAAAAAGYSQQGCTRYSAPEPAYADIRQLTSHALPICLLSADAPVDPAEGVEADPAAGDASQVPQHPMNVGVIPKRRLAGELMTVRLIRKL
jgi:hypothetical protein